MAPSATASARRVEIGLTAFCNGPNLPIEIIKRAQVVDNSYSWLLAMIYGTCPQYVNTAQTTLEKRGSLQASIS
jgi:hypothetical protein